MKNEEKSKAKMIYCIHKDIAYKDNKPFQLAGIANLVNMLIFAYKLVNIFKLRIL